MPNAAWLVVVDMQTVFADPDSPWGTPGFDSIVPVVQRLVEEHLPRVAFTRFVAPQAPSGAWAAYYEQWPFALVGHADPLYDIVPEVWRPGQPVISRPTFGKWDAELAGIVGDDPEVLLAGVSTDCCVLSTALAAADAGVRVRVVADACAAPSVGDHERALQVMSLYAPLVEITESSALGVVTIPPARPPRLA
jgi:nicotinamidase-related amidase